MQDLEALSSLMPTLYFWQKNLDSVYIDCNSALARLFAFKNRLAMQGRTDYDIPCKASELAHIFQREDKAVIKKQTFRRYLNVSQYKNDEWKTILVTKNPLKDSANNIIGTFAYAQDLSGLEYSISQLIRKNMNRFGHNPGEYLLTTDVTVPCNSDIYLTVRENECLFLLLHGGTAKQIAQTLHLSRRTVETYIDNIKIKFDCNSKSELISKAIALGYLDTIPLRFLQNDLLI